MQKLINIIIITCALFGIIVETYLHLIFPHNSPNYPESITGRLIFFYSYFTVLSNLALAIGCFILLINPKCTSTSFRILRIDSLVCIFITGLVYNLVLYTGSFSIPIMKYTSFCLHVITPFMAIVSWFFFGPRKLIDKRVMGWAIIPPLLYVIYIFIRGQITGLYPYPFLDAGKIGLNKALLNTGVIVIIFIAFEFLLFFVDSLMAKSKNN